MYTDKADPLNLTKAQADCLRDVFEGRGAYADFGARMCAGGARARMIERLRAANLITMQHGTHKAVLTPKGKQALEHYRIGKPFKPGKCRTCGCTDDRACPGGCSWVPGTNRTLCSACAP